RFSRDWSSDVCSSDLPEFGKIQIACFTLMTIVLGFFIDGQENIWYYQGALLLMFIHHASTLIKYTPLYPVKKHTRKSHSSQHVQIGRASCRERVYSSV